MTNSFFKAFFRYRYRRIQQFVLHPQETQNALLENLLWKGQKTVFGKEHRFDTIHDYTSFSNSIDVHDYDDIKAYIFRAMHGEPDVLWPGVVKWFSKSSGTTNDKSKFIPVTHENLYGCHIKGTWDTMNLYYHNRSQAKQFQYKSMIMGGSLQAFPAHPDTVIGDVSAIMIDNMPAIGRRFFAIDRETALLSDWELKLERLAKIGLKEKRVVMFGGVPTWTVVLFRRMLEISGKCNMLEIWPEFQVYIHGGVNFAPYKAQFQTFFPGDQVDYMEIYNATEGYFAAQDDLSRHDMLLLLNNGIFYEFLPIEHYTASPKAVKLSDVELHKHYAIMISTNSGLWRYLPGDTVQFTSTFPYRIKITGRTKQFVNVFGEEVVIENTDRAIAMTCHTTGAIIHDYTVGPIFMAGLQQKGGHEWLVEFEKNPADINQFADLLDKNLQNLNSDYEAKRSKDIALQPLQLRVLPSGTFQAWLRSKGKMGAQIKVPRLANNRIHIDDILNFLAAKV